LDDYVDEFGRTLGEELLEPTRIYVKAVKNLRRNFQIHGISHITGGGLMDNLPRVLPASTKAVIRKSSWTPPAVFNYLQQAGEISEGEMMRIFNNGIGLVVVLSEQETEEALERLNAMGETAYPIGFVDARKEDEETVQFAD
jgi:phosphoribosylformylglycinamidine cyclo-ligase